jgi:hypothetical protein
MTARAQLRASELSIHYGFTARYWIKRATAGTIPGARQPSGPKGHWLFDRRVFARWAAANGFTRRAEPPRQRKPLRKARREDCIYLLYSAAHIKIGVSCNVTRRQHGFSTASPCPIALLATMDGSNDAEVAIHARFNAARGRGEWFRLTPELRSFIAEVQQSGRSFVALEIAEAEFRNWLTEHCP